MKSCYKTTLIALILITFFPAYAHRPVSTGMSVAGVVITYIATWISGIKFIKAFITRHDYARNFISDARGIETYLINAHAVTNNRRSKMRSKTLYTRTLASHSYANIIQKCCEWEKEIDSDLVIVVQPAVSLHSKGFYKLKRLIFKGTKQRKFLQEKLVSHFEVPSPNRWTYGKEATLWAVLFGASYCGWLLCMNNLIFKHAVIIPGRG